VTASSFREEEARARKVCDGFVRKPFNRADLIAELQRFLRPIEKREVTESAAVPAAVQVEAPGAVPANALAQRPELIARLRDERETVWPRLRQTMDMRELEEFARRLKMWADDGHLPALRAYAATLLQQVEAFDVDRLPKTLEDFASVCETTAHSAP
jgi:hypothetical protein